ncbi:MAG: L,D-transpeptidase [Caldilineaceae bacterium]
MNLSVGKSAWWLGRSMFTSAKKTRRYPPVMLQLLLVGLLSLPLWLTGVRAISAKEKSALPAAPVQSSKPNTGYAATQPTGAMTNALIPPLPFTEPEVGPLIKNSYPDDINRRTTAFIPESLDNLSPIKLPDTDSKWIRVDLSEQIAVAYEGKTPIRAFRISSGLPNTPTVTGAFHIRTKVVSQTMTGGEGSMYYNLPGVKWVQYFYEDYSFHGTYWHNNFGHPMSHGCVNMTNADAKWLFDWAAPTWDGKTVWFKSKADAPGTLVIIHE